MNDDTFRNSDSYAPGKGQQNSGAGPQGYRGGEGLGSDDELGDTSARSTTATSTASDIDDTDQELEDE